MGLQHHKQKQEQLQLMHQLFLIQKCFLIIFLSNSSEYQKQVVHRRPNIKKSFGALPKEFNRKKAIDLAKKIGISERSADGYLKKLTDESLIKKLNHGVYKK